MEEFEDYYAVLGVNSKATADDIKRAYRDKCFILHPDRMEGAPESAKRRAGLELRRVNGAYDVLKDTQKRQEYDAKWIKQKSKPKAEAPQPPYQQQYPQSQQANYRNSSQKPKQIKTKPFLTIALASLVFTIIYLLVLIIAEPPNSGNWIAVYFLGSVTFLGIFVIGGIVLLIKHIISKIQTKK